MSVETEKFSEFVVANEEEMTCSVEVTNEDKNMKHKKILIMI